MTHLSKSKGLFFSPPGSLQGIQSTHPFVLHEGPPSRVSPPPFPGFLLPHPLVIGVCFLRSLSCHFPLSLSLRVFPYRPITFFRRRPPPPSPNSQDGQCPCPFLFFLPRRHFVFLQPHPPPPPTPPTPPPPQTPPPQPPPPPPHPATTYQ